MSALAMAAQRRRVNPALIVALLGGAGAGCLAVAVVQVVAATGPAVLVAGVIALAGWLVKTVAAVVSLPVLAGLVVALAVAPWLLLAVLTCLALRQHRRWTR